MAGLELEESEEASEDEMLSSREAGADAQGSASAVGEIVLNGTAERLAQAGPVQTSNEAKRRRRGAPVSRVNGSNSGRSAKGGQGAQSHYSTFSQSDPLLSELGMEKGKKRPICLMTL